MLRFEKSCKVTLGLFCCMCLVKPASGISTSAECVVLMEQESGRVLYAENENSEELIASITKLLTALVAVESGKDLSEVVAIGPESCNVEGSSLYLTTETEITLEALLYGMLLHSGNDAATAIAAHCAGSVEAFVEQMNLKAQELGMEHSAFANPHGLNAENHYSSAYDMALVAQACLENSTVAEMVATKQIRLCGRTFTNKNKLLSLYEGCVGMKTGYTELAGRTLVSAATRDGMTLICVTLNDRDDWEDHSALFDYGFATYRMAEFTVEERENVPLEGHVLSFATVGSDTIFRYPVKEGEEIIVEMSVETQLLETPIKKGDVLEGEVVWKLGQQAIGRNAVVSLYDYEGCTVATKGIWERITALLRAE